MIQPSLRNRQGRVNVESMLSLNGVNQYAITDYNNTLSRLIRRGRAFSFSMNFMIRNDSKEQTILDFSSRFLRPDVSVFYKGVYLNYDPSLTHPLVLKFSADNLEDTFSCPNVETSVLNHLVFSIDASGNWSFFLNGKLNQSGTSTNTWDFDSYSRLVIGGFRTVHGFMDAGLMADLAISHLCFFNTALQRQDAEALHSLGGVIPESIKGQCVAHYPMTQRSGEVVYDQVGQYNTITLDNYNPGIPNQTLQHNGIWAYWTSSKDWNINNGQMYVDDSSTGLYWYTYTGLVNPNDIAYAKVIVSFDIITPFNDDGVWFNLHKAGVDLTDKDNTSKFTQEGSYRVEYHGPVVDNELLRVYAGEFNTEGAIANLRVEIDSRFSPNHAQLKNFGDNEHSGNSQSAWLDFNSKEVLESSSVKLFNDGVTNTHPDEWLRPVNEITAISQHTYNDPLFYAIRMPVMGGASRALYSLLHQSRALFGPGNRGFWLCLQGVGSGRYVLAYSPVGHQYLGSSPYHQLPDQTYHSKEFTLTGGEQFFAINKSAVSNGTFRIEFYYQGQLLSEGTFAPPTFPVQDMQQTSNTLVVGAATYNHGGDCKMVGSTISRMIGANAFQNREAVLATYKGRSAQVDSLLFDIAPQGSSGTLLKDFSGNDNDFEYVSSDNVDADTTEGGNVWVERHSGTPPVRKGLALPPSGYVSLPVSAIPYSNVGYIHLAFSINKYPQSHLFSMSGEFSSRVLVEIQVGITGNVYCYIKADASLISSFYLEYGNKNVACPLKRLNTLTWVFDGSNYRVLFNGVVFNPQVFNPLWFTDLSLFTSQDTFNNGPMFRLGSRHHAGNEAFSSVTYYDFHVGEHVPDNREILTWHNNGFLSTPMTRPFYRLNFNRPVDDNGVFKLKNDGYAGEGATLVGYTSDNVHRFGVDLENINGPYRQQYITGLGSTPSKQVFIGRLDHPVQKQTYIKKL